MSIFVALMLAGLAGLVLMALPGLGHRGHVALHGGGHAGTGSLHLGHTGHIGHGVQHATGSHAAGDGAGRGDGGLFWLIPSPRVIFSLMTLFGAFGYALVGSAHMAAISAGLLAAAPAVLVERFALTPLWNLLFRFEGAPSVPLEALSLGEARAVTPFHNGRGLVSAVHDGRLVQFRAELPESQKTMPVRVGDALRIEEVDAPNERVTVSLQ